mmetsp:Transcript_33177/g.73117  ORF Transcript_33177/g.73117 Transcript_33177/m.73117 type:complete len:331 (+) Transcript_33177:578-1570(+)
MPLDRGDMAARRRRFYQHFRLSHLMAGGRYTLRFLRDGLCGSEPHSVLFQGYVLGRECDGIHRFCRHAGHEPRRDRGGDLHHVHRLPALPRAARRHRHPDVEFQSGQNRLQQPRGAHQGAHEVQENPPRCGAKGTAVLRVHVGEVWGGKRDRGAGGPAEVPTGGRGELCDGALSEPHSLLLHMLGAHGANDRLSVPAQGLPARRCADALGGTWERDVHHRVRTGVGTKSGPADYLCLPGLRLLHRRVLSARPHPPPSLGVRRELRRHVLPHVRQLPQGGGEIPHGVRDHNRGRQRCDDAEKGGKRDPQFGGSARPADPQDIQREGYIYRQ